MDRPLDAADLCPHCMSPMQGRERCPKCQFIPSAYTPARHHLPPFTILNGQYLVGCLLGEGGFGITYVGMDLRLRTMVAIKEFFPTGVVYRDNAQNNAVCVFSGSGEAIFFHDREKFLEEARMLARFDGNPGVVGVKNYFCENGTAYIIMEYVQGITLDALAEHSDGRLPFRQVLRLLELPMRTLAEMHRQNTFHRDISPENLMIADGGVVKLIDFGATRTGDATKSTFLKVRPGYSALEMYADEGREGAWSDIYSLCATIYRVTTGVTPPPAADRVQQDTLVPPIDAGATGMSPAQERALMKGLAVRPEDRFQCMGDLSEALAVGMPPKRRLPLRALVAGLAAAVCVALGLFLLLRSRPAPFALTEDMFKAAPELWAGYQAESGYPCEARVYVTGSDIRFTRYEGDDDWSQTERRDPMDGKQLKRTLDTLRASGIPIGEIVLQNLRLESVEGLDAPWPNPLHLIVDQCDMPDDWRGLAGMGDSLVSLHIGGRCDNSDLSWMTALTGLKWLALGGEGIDLESVSKLQWLPGLSFGEAGIRDLTPFTRMQALTALCLPGCKVSDLSPLAGMPWLECLEIPGNDISDLSPLAGLENLRLVNVTANRIRDFSPIQRDGIEIIGQDEQR